MYLCEQFFLRLKTDSSQKNAQDNFNRVSKIDSRSLSSVLLADRAPFEMSISLLETCEETTIVEGIVNALITVISQVGISVEHVLSLISCLTKNGFWPPSALNIINGLCSLASADPAARLLTNFDAPDPPRAMPLSGVRPPARPYFRFDGDGGLYLGGAQHWPFDKGYAFEAWFFAAPTAGDIAAAATGADAPLYLFRIVAADAEGNLDAAAAAAAASPPAAVLDVCLAGNRLELRALNARAFPCSVPVPAARGRWVHVAVSHARSMLSSKVSVWVDGRAAAARPLPYPSHRAAVRVYAGCAGWRAASGGEDGADLLQVRGQSWQSPTPRTMQMG